MTVVRIALAQLDPTVGDLDGNVAKLIEAYDRADAAGCDIVAYPELSITAYPPEDLVLKPGFVADNRAALERFAAHTRDCVAVVGFVDADRDIYDAAAICVERWRDRHLPQATARQLRRVRRGAHVHARHRQRSARALRDRRGQGRRVDLRGHLVTVRTARRAGRRRRRAERQHQRISVSLGEGHRTGTDGRHPRPGRPHPDRLRQPGRRTGRARVRRWIVRGRRRRPAAGPRPAVRRRPDDRRRADPGGVPTPSARPARQAHRGQAPDRARQRRQPAPARFARRRSDRRPTRSRTRSCTKRSCSAPATTAARTGSPTS